MLLLSTEAEVRDRVRGLKTGADEYIGKPYDANWLLFQHISNMPALRGRRFIITTTNEKHVRGLAGQQQLFEIVGKPYDLTQLSDAVKAILSTPEDRA